jgi:hypothetical protein
MAHPWVVDDEGDSLQIWRVAVNILDKQSQTDNNVCGPPAWGLNEELTTQHKKTNLLQHVTQGLGIKILWNDLQNGKWI